MPGRGFAIRLHFLHFAVALVKQKLAKGHSCEQRRLTSVKQMLGRNQGVGVCYVTSNASMGYPILNERKWSHLLCHEDNPACLNGILKNNLCGHL